MLTVEKLNEYGADTKTGLARCVNMESMYLRLVGTVPGNVGFETLEKAITEGDLQTAFEAAHGLKGALTNLSLTPLADPVVEITEHLRAGDKMDYTPCLEEIRKQRERLRVIVEGE